MVALALLQLALLSVLMIGAAVAMKLAKRAVRVMYVEIAAMTLEVHALVSEIGGAQEDLRHLLHEVDAVVRATHTVVNHGPRIITRPPE